jgi:hypothetical protein
MLPKKLTIAARRGNRSLPDEYPVVMFPLPRARYRAAWEAPYLFAITSSNAIAISEVEGT